MKIAKFVLLLLIVGSLFNSSGTNASLENITTTSSINGAEIEHGDSILQTEVNYSRPILKDVTYQTGTSNNALVLRDRNDTLGEGGIFQVQEGTNVTVRYEVVNGTASHKVYFQTDVPSLNSSLSPSSATIAEMGFVSSSSRIGYVIPYTGEIVNASVAIYSITFEMNASYVHFFARVESLSETDSNGPYNLLTADKGFTTKSSENFYIQTEDVKIRLSGVNATSDDVYGIKYKTNSDQLFSFENFTVTIESNKSVSGEINLGMFKEGTTISWISVAYLNDTGRNTTFTITNLDVKEVEIGDGTPELDFTVDKLLVSDNSTLRSAGNVFFTQSRSLKVGFNASVPKGNIAEFNFYGNSSLNTEINQTITVTNASEIQEITINTPNDGLWNITLVAFTDKGFNATTSFDVVVDTKKPEGEISVNGQSSGRIFIKSDGRSVTFDISHSDELSGVYLASIDFGDGFAKEVTGLSNYTYRYVENDVYNVTYTVVDNAGNSISTFFSVVINTEDLSEKFAPVSFAVFSVALLAIPLIRRKSGIFN